MGRPVGALRDRSYSHGAASDRLTAANLERTVPLTGSHPQLAHEIGHVQLPRRAA